MDEDGLVETRHFDEKSGSLTVKTSYDSTGTIEANKKARNRTPETGKFKQSNNGLVHALRIEMGDVIRLRNIGYNLLSPDRDEVRRALLYIQQNEPWHIPTTGKVFTKNRTVWT